MDLRESIRLIHESEIVIGQAFYEQLLARHPELSRHFDGIDMRRQAILFTMQLAVVAAYADGHSAAAEQYLQVLGTQHARRGIPRETYAAFRDCLLDVLASFHSDHWHEGLARQWHEAMNAAIQKMWEGYDSRFHV